MSGIISKEYINTIVNNIAITLHLKDWRYEEEKLGLIAQNYFGILFPIVLKGHVNDEYITYRIMLKLAPSDDRYRVSGAVTSMFAREIFVYSKVFQTFEKLQRYLKLDLKFILPKCYYVCQDYCKEAIAMQNVCENGYQPYVNYMFLDIDHLTISFKCLAKFHALSMILEVEQNDIYEEIKKVCVPLSEKTNKRFLNILDDRLEKAIQKFENSTYDSLLKDLKANCVEYINAAFLSTEKNCLCHGDIWKENFMFKYEDNKPISACMIDYQTARICSPAFDILYLIASSTDSKLRIKFLNMALDIYYNTLINILADAEVDHNKIYKRSQFENDLRIVAPACLIVANTSIWLSSALQEEGHVRSKNVLHTESEKAAAVEKYKSAIRGIIDDFYLHGYLSFKSDDTND